MARNRIPPAKAAVSGAVLKNPARHADRTNPGAVLPLGEPYERMTEAQKEVWRECADEMPWLNGAHRRLLRLVCILAARMDEGEFGVAASNALSAMLSKLGATPVDESKVGYVEPDGDDLADEFFRSRPN